MSTPSFPLIGIDRNYNEHPTEYPGLNAKDAAEKLASLYGYIEVLSNDKGKQMRNYRQPLFKSDKARRESENSAFALLLGNVLLKNGSSIIQHLRNKGMTVKLGENTGKERLLVNWPIHANVTQEDREALRDFIRPKTQMIIDALHAEGTPTESAAPPDIYKGRSKREVLLSILPQMPNPFTKQHFIDRLKAAGYIGFAANRVAVLNGISYCTRPDGEVTRVGTGKYEVKEAFRHRKPPTIVESLPERPPPVQPVEPPVHAASPVAPEPKSPAPEPAPPVDQPVLAVNPFIGLLDLASQAATGDDDAADLAAKLTEACEVFVSTVLDAASALTSAIKPVADRLNKQNMARQALVRSLTKSSES